MIYPDELQEMSTILYTVVSQRLKMPNTKQVLTSSSSGSVSSNTFSEASTPTEYTDKRTAFSTVEKRIKPDDIEEDCGMKSQDSLVNAKLFRREAGTSDAE